MKQYGKVQKVPKGNNKANNILKLENKQKTSN